MFNKLVRLFKTTAKETEEQSYLSEQNIYFDQDQGPIVDGIVLSDLNNRLEYFSNRKLENFQDLKKLFEISLQINEKIDLEIATGRYVERLGNNEQNLKELKKVIEKLNSYYKKFLRDRV
ncbi:MULTISPECIES: hypothetical protein [Acinetobacter]|jgi:hypothetical protein|uniref:hypothetical protein n=1 Tax=Acinetobacter TaxID=469 RepID=UPI00157A5045|nr:hypothetical protein [Acinetobacter radioresistens]MCK4080476.1 hypothetical protein [Acinetobacter radioresistens]MCK4110709.1 hypothetical protein [Acinetobacter radioresistens]MCU4385467.1 hypothetical protein [Acinetobacter radioresistens]NTY97680.1 hypothetical protein [Acinetobacter radioresistens]